MTLTLSPTETVPPGGNALIRRKRSSFRSVPMIWFDRLVSVSPGFTVTTRMRSGLMLAFLLRCQQAETLDDGLRGWRQNRTAGWRCCQEAIDPAAGVDDENVEFPAVGTWLSRVAAGIPLKVAACHAGIVETRYPAAAHVIRHRRGCRKPACPSKRIATSPGPVAMTASALLSMTKPSGTVKLTPSSG